VSDATGYRELTHGDLFFGGMKVCLRCGTATVDTEAHDTWHAEPKGPSIVLEATLSETEQAAEMLARFKGGKS
jgi:hypothetical protein